MTVQQIVDIAKTVPGFSYWWGGSKWKPGAADKGKCIPNGSSGCPNCSHTGAYGADCSGFVGKAWQVDKPMALDVAYHPYSTVHFTGSTTWWTHPPKADAQLGDAFTYNKNGAGHIFLYEKGNVWGNVYAWECKGCSYGCTYGLRTVSADYINARRKLIQAPAPTCKKHCEGTKIVDEKCSVGDCAAYGAKCVDDSLGVRCVSVFCPAQGTTTTCLPDPKNGKIATCVNGALKDEANCGAYGAICNTAVPPKPKCVAALCEDDPKTKPVAGDLCHQGKRLTCNAAGDISDKPCPAGAICTSAAGTSGPGSATCGGKPCGNCDDGNPCTSDGCSNGTCTHTNKALPCDDNNACTTDDACASGACKGQTKDCGDANPCTADSCGPNGCQHKPTSGPCDDGDACTTGGGCQNGVCDLGVAKNCDDDNPCTTDSCAAGNCDHAHVEGGCDDGDACTWYDHCAAGLCLAGFAKQCSDGNPCTLDQCADGDCVHSPNGPTLACDGNVVITTEACSGAILSKKPCATGVACVDGVCQVASSAGGATQSGDGSAASHGDSASGTGGDGSLAQADATGVAAATGSVGNTGASSSSCKAGPAPQGDGWAWLLALCALGLTRRRN